ncbi:MAG: T9SS type A sorting domain-containing protein [Bacteroidetes bacterium]|jgi:hypothetical protein|nr:T9SS type A sorting domain-containing protein [Bacteroidota bacterium]
MYRSITNYGRTLSVVGLLFALALLVTFVWLEVDAPAEDANPAVAAKLEQKLAKQQRKKARTEYFHQLLRDPATDQIPSGIRARELAFARTLPKHAAKQAQWTEIGPTDVGGRTRALAVDVANPNVVIAGGASGGIWKSTNGGQSWTLKTALDEVHTVTALVQDPRPGMTNVWYYGTGEFDGSTRGRVGGASVRGEGIWKSTDNGETWQQLPSTIDGDITQFDSPFDHIARLVINPTTGTLFAASNGFGVLRSTDGGASFQLVHGGPGEHAYADVAPASNGLVMAALSQQTAGGTPTTDPGIYVSTDDGQSWGNITPNDPSESFPSTHGRTYLAFAPSDPNVAYSITFTGFTVDGQQNFYQVDDDVRLFRYDYDLNQGMVFYDDRSRNLPSNQGTGSGVFNTQSNYNLVLTVKPDDPDFVIFGGTNLYRSRDGFASPVTMNDWIGGYSPGFPDGFALYPNHHPDQHSLAFHPSNPDLLWSGHDGGLGTADVTASAVTWTSQNNGYNVTQYYHASIHDEADDPRIVGGTQDNGSPFLATSLGSNSLGDVSSGDGSYSYVGDDFLFTSSQTGFVNRIPYAVDPSEPDLLLPDGSNAVQGIQPPVQGQLFIHPFAVDPLDERVMYYPAGNVLYRNNTLDAAPQGNTFPGWQQLNAGAPNGTIITALTPSSDPSGPSTLYFGASSSNQPPRIFRLDNATTATGGAADVSMQGAAAGTFVSCLAVNPSDAGEVLAVMSNYNVESLYHTTDGGASWTAVEGNLSGSGNLPGPSVRCATILPTGTETQYVVATSTGLYSTTQLNGSSTTWMQEAADVLGNVVVSYVTSRPSDGQVIAATHGRGLFGAQFEVSSGGGAAALATSASSLTLDTIVGRTTSASFQVQNVGGEPLTYSISVTEPTEPAPGPTFKAGRHGVLTATTTTGRRYRFDGSATAGPALDATTAPGAAASTAGPGQSDTLILDDGDDTADTFVGFDDGNVFVWANEFVPSSAFSLEGFTFFMRTEDATTNTVELAVLDASGEALVEGTLEYNTAQNGDTFGATLDPPLTFAAGEAFRIVVGTQGGIDFPAGYDEDAAVTGQSFFSDGGGTFTSVEETQFAGGAFIIRAQGTLEPGGGGGGGGDRLQVTPTSGTVQPGAAETITATFDATGLAAGTYRGRLDITSNGGTQSLPVTATVNANVSTEDGAVPTAVHLAANYPNPFNPSTRITYTLPQPGQVTLRVYDVAGRRVATLHDRAQGAGTHVATWDGRDQAGRAVASGTYLYRLEVVDASGRRHTQTRAMVLLK